MAEVDLMPIKIARMLELCKTCANVFEDNYSRSYVILSKSENIKKTYE